MASRRCSLCGISYPIQKLMCPVHESPTVYNPHDDVDEDWEWRATAILVQSEDIPTIELQPAPLRSGMYTLDVDAVSRTGRRLAVDDVFMIPPDSTYKPDGPHPCNCFWEVIGLYEPDNKWIVRPLRVPDSLPPGGNEL